MKQEARHPANRARSVADDRDLCSNGGERFADRAGEYRVWSNCAHQLGSPRGRAGDPVASPHLQQFIESGTGQTELDPATSQRLLSELNTDLVGVTYNALRCAAPAEQDRSASITSDLGRSLSGSRTRQDRIAPPRRSSAPACSCRFLAVPPEALTRICSPLFGACV